MNSPSIKTTNQIIPMIYGYTTPEIARHDGWTKIGYTEQDVDTRIKQQTHTADVKYNLEWKGLAAFDDGSGETFADYDFHSFLEKTGIKREAKTEWFNVSGADSHMLFYNFRANRFSGIKSASVSTYKLRAEQSDAVTMATKHFSGGLYNEVLWNCKPRFGKTLSTYDFIKQINAKKVLIVTNRPAIANSWYSDYEKFVGTDNDYMFVSTSDSIKDKRLVQTYETFKHASSTNNKCKLIYFLSLQDLKGSVHFGGKFNKLAEIKAIDWDILVIDEAHEGVDTLKTDVAFDHIKRKFTLHLSGTPFKALANDKFREECIFNWTYADEQAKKREWNSEENNPYEALPQLNMYTYQMSEIVKEELGKGVVINGVAEEYAFDLNLFFETNKTGRFVHDGSVDHFLDALTRNEKFPFSTDALREELKHTFWILNRVDSAKALARKLQAHPVFKDYFIVLAAGDGKLDDSEETQKALDRVREAIKEHDKTITLSVGQLTTGVTIPEWTAVLMLSNMKSPALYMQAAFRAQNPWKYSKGTQYFRKENAYLFDFDPARTLTIFEEFANDLSSETSDGRGDMATRRENVRKLLNFFPVIGEDENGEMVSLDAEKVLSIPRKIHSQEVVKRGFMSDFLFQNIANVFHAPKIVLKIIKTFDPVQEPKTDFDVSENTADELGLNENGEVVVPDSWVDTETASLFGDKLYEVTDRLDEEVDKATIENEKSEDPYQAIKDAFKKEAIDPLLIHASEKYENELKPANKKRLERKLVSTGAIYINRITGEHEIKKKENELELQEMLDKASSESEALKARQAYEEKVRVTDEEFRQKINSVVDDFVKDSAAEIVRTIETQKREDAKAEAETKIKNHLRGFSRTIPSFLMAYGDDKTTLKNFDTIVSAKVFEEVTSITLEEFRFLRDGGNYVDEVTGEEKYFAGNIFNDVVFDDSIKEFLNLRKELADYFDESSEKDIFDFIPQQKTNLVYTPKKVVKEMADLLEQENPGCFNNPDKTFIDLYMKSGLYITEIVKRLYRSEALKKRYPDREARLKHIFEKQVYGLAPTEIIYNIAKNYVLGFSDEINIEKHNLRMADSLQLIKEGKLEEYLEKEFGGDANA